MIKTSGQRTQFYFAGGGTGGHIYPALAIASELKRQVSEAEIVFFCSSRAVDARILAAQEYEFFPLPIEGFSINPLKFVSFWSAFLKSYYFAKQLLHPLRDEAVLIGTGGFVSAPAIMAAHALKVPVFIVNVDYVPGKANRFLARYAKAIFTQFDQTADYFAKYSHNVVSTGCALRAEFARPDADHARHLLGLDPDKKVLLVTGASSGSLSINRAMLELLGELAVFSEDWQVVHLTGQVHYEAVRSATADAAIAYHAVDYCDAMADLYAVADIIVGRSGAVSVAEYAAAGRPAVCVPYPYHKDNHQKLNAAGLVQAGGAVIVEDIIGNTDQTAAALMDVLGDLMSNASRREQMARAAGSVARIDAAQRIAASILKPDSKTGT